MHVQYKFKNMLVAILETVKDCSLYEKASMTILGMIQVTQPVGYVGTLPAIRIHESTAEWTAKDCYVSLLGGGTVYMSTCETTAEWTIRDCRYEYV
jgi:hypothetical protein